ncbi:MAG: response regulator [candidate division KSB1 bacterium]|nr:response regulator [candidate division KSB1 bacterium]MDZ7303258.1 response regulator [candidate division KSB1 bacterium]MDZ7312562.1 response regulator [candidate division KSB1 bacterium]
MPFLLFGHGYDRLHADNLMMKDNSPVQKPPVKKIITIDDEAPIRSLIRHSLRQEDYEVIEAGDGNEGLEIIRREQPDLIVLDYVMPVMNGAETLRAIRSDPQIAHIPVLFLTGIKDLKKLEPLLQDSLNDFLDKPFLVETLKERVRKLLHRESSAAIPRN